SELRDLRFHLGLATQLRSEQNAAEQEQSGQCCHRSRKHRIAPRPTPQLRRGRDRPGNDWSMFQPTLQVSGKNGRGLIASGRVTLETAGTARFEIRLTLFR